MALTVTTHSDLADPAVVSAWSALASANSSTNVFSSFDWCQAWAGTLGRHTVPLMHVVHADGRPIALLPTGVQRRGPARWLTFLGRDGVSGDHLDLVCAPSDHDAALGALLPALASDPRFDGLWLGDLHEDSPTRTALLALARRSGWPVCEREPQVVPFVDLPPAFDAFLGTLSANMRYHVRRRLRNAERDGVVVQTLTDIEPAAAALEHLFRLHTHRWQRAGLSGNFHHSGKREFLADFVRRAAPRREICITALQRDTAVLGVLLAFHHRGVASFYQMGWLPESSVKSPGVVLLAESIRAAITAGCTTYDFLRGDEPYKQRWTTRYVRQTTVVVAQRAPARAALAARRFIDGCKHVVRRAVGSATWDEWKRWNDRRVRRASQPS